MIETLKDTFVGLSVVAIVIAIAVAIVYVILPILGPLGIFGIFYGSCFLFVSWALGGEIRRKWLKK